MSLFGSTESAVGALRQAFASGRIVQAPGCFDALSAKVLERAGFAAAFLSGFGVSGARLGLPDAGLMSYSEVLDQGRNVCDAVSIPLLGDADTGYGNEVNVERTVRGFARAGFAGLMIEDQVWPKRCGHTRGKQTVDRKEAVARVRAAVRARSEAGLDLLLIARTDAAGTVGFDEALRRAEAFAEAGAEITFVEAPRTVEEMRLYCESVPGWKMANLLEDGLTPWASPGELEEIGYSLVAYPLSLQLAGLEAMNEAAVALRGGSSLDQRASFDALQEIVGFPAYRSQVDD